MTYKRKEIQKMIIDAHVHAFADNIAERAITKLETVSGVKAATDGTSKGMREQLKKCGIDYGVLLPVATKPTQQATINNWAKEEYRDGIISFGSVHPYAEDVEEEIERIKTLGLKGVKIHNDYQGVFIFDEKCDRMYKKCEELGLPIVFHMGYDPISQLVHRAMPYDLIELTEKYPKLKIIGAHMGGVYAWESVYKYIAGNRNIWLDTSFVAGYLDEKLFADIVKKHGTDRVMFASDLPWSNPADEIALVERLPISDNEKDRIFSGNVIDLLELNF